MGILKPKLVRKSIVVLTSEKNNRYLDRVSKNIAVKRMTFRIFEILYSKKFGKKKKLRRILHQADIVESSGNELKLS